ncbi:MAG: ABC transporter permease [Acidobacteria bacterium]|nr:ABC transporter permease [Acidobacteriota bacterium]
MFRRKRSAKDFAEEIRSHLELETDELKAEGLSDEEAHRQARVHFGNAIGSQERFNLRNRIQWLDNLARDAKFSVRQLVSNPSFALTAIIVLALGLAASTAIFALVDAALIKPLPFSNPKQLVSVYETVESCPLCNISYQNFRDWQRTARSFRFLEAWGYSRYTIRSSSGSESADGARVSDGFFRALGVAPMLGRDFIAGEDRPGAPRTVLLSYGAWQKRFGGDPSIVGKTVQLDETSYMVIGVLPRSFHFTPRGEADFWTTLNEPNGCDKRRACHGLFGLGRLNDGVGANAAADEMESVAAQLGRQYPDSNRGYGATVVPLTEVVVGEIRPVLMALFFAAALLLLIAYVNVAGLLLLRSEARRREIAVCGALGASSSRLAGQFVTEGLLLVAAGTIPGLAIAYAAIKLLPRLVPLNRIDGMPFLLDLGLNRHTVGFAASIAALAVILFAIVPALRLRRSNLHSGLADGGRGSGSTAWRRVGSKLVVVELAISVVMLLGAGLLGKSLYKLLHVDTGFRADHLSSVFVELPKSYTDAQGVALQHTLLDRVRNLPGSVSVGLTVAKPLRAWDLGTNIVVPGSAAPDKRHDVPERDVSAGYLPMLGAKLLRGRYFTEVEDDPAKPRVVITTKSLASELFPTEGAIGKRIAYSGSKEVMLIIGVIDDIKEGALDTPNRGVIYVPFNQNSSGSFELVVRSSEAPQTMLPMVIKAVHEVDKSIATSYATTMDDVIRDSNAAYLHRSMAWLVGSFALVALILSVVGIYGVIAYSVAQRSREIGVRMALGAQRRSIYGLVMRQASWLIAIGLVIGIACAAGMSGYLKTLLFGVKVWDGLAVAGTIAILGLASLFASFLPARRAASVNPVEALRAE